MKTIINLLGVKELDKPLAYERLNQSALTSTGRNFLENLIDENLDSFIAQSLIYTSSYDRHFSVASIFEEAFSPKYIFGEQIKNDFDKNLATLLNIVDRDLNSDNWDSGYTLSSMPEKDFDENIHFRYSSFQPEISLIFNRQKQESKIVYHGFLPGFLSEKNLPHILREGVNTIVRIGKHGKHFLPIGNLCEISSLLTRVTLDKEGEKSCKYNRQDLSL